MTINPLLLYMRKSGSYILIMNTPITNSYWVIPGKLLAGEYPDRTKLKALLDAGITRFIDLTAPEDCLEPYGDIINKLSGGKAVRHSFPVPDFSIPRTPGLMSELLDTVDREIASGEKVYIHCWGGIGRTGTAVGCWLARHGDSGTAGCGSKALEKLSRLWKTCPKSDIYPASPQTEEQRDYVINWNNSE